MSGAEQWRDAKAAFGMEDATGTALMLLKSQLGLDIPVKNHLIDELFTAMFEDTASKVDPTKTVYPYSFPHTKERLETELYHDSRKANAKCAKSIDKTIRDSCYKPQHYNLKAAARVIISEYGFARVNAVLAHTLQEQSYDGRYSRDNKAWAAGFDLRDINLAQATMQAHPILIDSLVRNVREMFAELSAERFALPGKPEQGEAVHGYAIQRSIFFDNDRGFALAHNPAAVEPFVTWQFTVENGQRNFYWGKYFSTGDAAGDSFSTRISVYLRDETAKEIDNPLAAVEMATEQNYNMIDGARNNLAYEKADLTDGQTHEEIRELAPETLPRDKPSVLEKLGKMKEHAKAQSPSPARESRNSGEKEL